MPDIVITEFMDLSAIDKLSAHFNVLYSPELVDQPQQLMKAMTNARAIIVRNRTQVTQVLLDHAPDLQVVGRLGVGLDNIDTGACERNGVTVYPATGANDIAVAEYVITTALILARKAYHSTTQICAGDWPRQHCVGREIRGLVMGLIGYGSIAQRTAKLALAMGMEVVAFDPYVRAEDEVWSNVKHAEDLENLLKTADIVSLHVPLTKDTRDLIDAKALSIIKPGALLINAARGGVIVEAALIEAMRTGRIGGAAIDVFENEPVDTSGGRQFSEIPNLLLTPHIAGVTEQSNVRVSSMIADKVAEHLGGNHG